VDALCIKIRMRIQITKGLRRPDHTGHIGEARIRFSDCKIRFSKSRIRFNKAPLKSLSSSVKPISLPTVSDNVRPWVERRTP
jgi:hypothetical protein